MPTSPREILVLGGGVGGTLVANVLARKLGRREAHMTVIDRTGRHVYQPGWLYVPFGGPPPKHWERPERGLLSRKVDLVVGDAERIDREAQVVKMVDGTSYPYDDLVIATGARLAPEAIPGYAEAAHHFYSPEAAVRLREALETFQGGKVLIGVADIPYKCPPAPLEFTFLLDEFLRKRGLRERTEITYLSPINRVFTIESVSTFVTPLLEERGIQHEEFFNTESIDPDRKTVMSMEGTELDYDLLVLVPPHRGVPLVVESGLGDAQGWIATDKQTLQAKADPRIYAIGDGTDVPVSKSGSAAHFEAKVVADRLTAEITGSPNGYVYDGRVMCFLETGYGQASQLSFDYEHPPRPPSPNHLYHYEKALFNHAYWYLVPPGRV
jgi:sulfide:quinone oxidoreductase